MKTSPFPILLCGLLWSLPSGSPAQKKSEVAPLEETTDPVDPEGAADPLPVLDRLLDQEPSVAVLPAEVSLDGIEHPALGRSLSDSLIGGLLAQGRMKVISYVEGKVVEDPKGEPGSAPEVLAGMLGRRMGAQKVLVPRLVGEGDFYRFTVKEIDAGTYEVSRVFELSHAGDQEGIFGFVPLVLAEFDEEGKVEKARREPKGRPVIKIWSWEEFRRDFGTGKTAPDQAGGSESKAQLPPRAVLAKPERPVPHLKTGTERQVDRSAPIAPAAVDARERGRRVAEMVALGKVMSVNDKWGFCVIDMTGRRLRESEEVEVRTEKSDAVYATLVVTRVEGNKAIADLADGQTGKRLFPGDVVFGWELR